MQNPKSNNKTILLVDDDIAVIDSIRDSLEKNTDYCISASQNPLDAEPLASLKLYTAIISDINMPEKSGIEFIEELRRNRIYAPVIFLSGFINSEGIQRINSLHLVSVLEKPVNESTLLSTVDKMVKIGAEVASIDDSLHKLYELDFLSEASLSAFQKLLYDLLKPKKEHKENSVINQR
ncbi:MAG: response regulator [Oligoflexia bacterium]|nr:response regulator [Oligoflexia bacterium]